MHTVDNEMNQWPWRDWYYTIKVCNFITSKFEDKDNPIEMNDKMKRIKGQALFLRGLSYYNLVGYYQNPVLITDYDTYYSTCRTQWYQQTAEDTDGKASITASGIRWRGLCGGHDTSANT